MDYPIILNPHKSEDVKIYQQLVSSGVSTRDYVASQLLELHKLNLRINDTQLNKSINWIYYPWRQIIVKILDEKHFNLLRTSRNNPLYSKSEQAKMAKLVIGVAGLSVGSNIVRSLVYAGIGKLIKIADSDVLETTNLNRITSNLLDLGQNKALNMARQIWDLNPYQQIEIFDHGITADNLDSFLQHPKLDILFDEVDDLGLKIHLKLAARAEKIIYMMVTDNGYQAELDVARFDLSPKVGGMSELPILPLNWILEGLKTSEKILLSPKQEQNLINTLIGDGPHSKEMTLAGELKLRGKIAGWPQLQIIASVGASMAVVAIKKLVNRQLKSGKKVISLIE